MGQILMGPGRNGFNVDIITDDGLDLVLNFVGAGGASLKNGSVQDSGVDYILSKFK